MRVFAEEVIAKPKFTVLYGDHNVAGNLVWIRLNMTGTGMADAETLAYVRAVKTGAENSDRLVDTCITPMLTCEEMEFFGTQALSAERTKRDNTARWDAKRVEQCIDTWNQDQGRIFRTNLRIATFIDAPGQAENWLPLLPKASAPAISKQLDLSPGAVGRSIKGLTILHPIAPRLPEEANDFAQWDDASSRRLVTILPFTHAVELAARGVNSIRGAEKVCAGHTNTLYERLSEVKAWNDLFLALDSQEGVPINGIKKFARIYNCCMPREGLQDVGVHQRRLPKGDPMWGACRPWFISTDRNVIMHVWSALSVFSSRNYAESQRINAELAAAQLKVEKKNVLAADAARKAGSLHQKATLSVKDAELRDKDAEIEEIEARLAAVTKVAADAQRAQADAQRELKAAQAEHAKDRAIVTSSPQSESGHTTSGGAGRTQEELLAATSQAVLLLSERVPAEKSGSSKDEGFMASHMNLSATKDILAFSFAEHAKYQAQWKLPGLKAGISLMDGAVAITIGAGFIPTSEEDIKFAYSWGRPEDAVVREGMIRRAERIRELTVDCDKCIRTERIGVFGELISISQDTFLSLFRGNCPETRILFNHTETQMRVFAAKLVAGGYLCEMETLLTYKESGGKDVPLDRVVKTLREAAYKRGLPSESPSGAAFTAVIIENLLRLYVAADPLAATTYHSAANFARACNCGGKLLKANHRDTFTNTQCEFLAVALAVVGMHTLEQREFVMNACDTAQLGCFDLSTFEEVLIPALIWMHRNDNRLRRTNSADLPPEEGWEAGAYLIRMNRALRDVVVEHGQIQYVGGTMGLTLTPAAGGNTGGGALSSTPNAALGGPMLGGPLAGNGNNQARTNRQQEQVDKRKLQSDWCKINHIAELDAQLAGRWEKHVGNFTASYRVSDDLVPVIGNCGLGMRGVSHANVWGMKFSRVAEKGPVNSRAEAGVMGRLHGGYWMVCAIPELKMPDWWPVGLCKPKFADGACPTQHKRGNDRCKLSHDLMDPRWNLRLIRDSQHQQHLAELKERVFNTEGSSMNTGGKRRRPDPSLEPDKKKKKKKKPNAYGNWDDDWEVEEETPSTPFGAHNMWAPPPTTPLGTGTFGPSLIPPLGGVTPNDLVGNLRMPTAPAPVPPAGTTLNADATSFDPLAAGSSNLLLSENAALRNHLAGAFATNAQLASAAAANEALSDGWRHHGGHGGGKHGGGKGSSRRKGGGKKSGKGKKHKRK